MSSTWMWRAAALTVFINYLFYASSHLFWQHEWEKLRHLIPDALLPEEELGSSNDVWIARLYTYSFYRELVVEFVVQLIDYRWQIFLERLLPNRPRARLQDLPPSAQLPHVDHAEEEKIIQKLVAEGKIRRASISWCNIFLKWVLQVSVGAALFSTLGEILPKIASLSLSLEDVQAVPIRAFAGMVLRLLFTSGPFAWLVSYVIIPARFRVPFASLLMLLVMLFFSASLHMFLPWFLQTEFAESVFSNMVADVARASGLNQSSGVGEEFQLPAP